MLERDGSSRDEHNNWLSKPKDQPWEYASNTIHTKQQIVLKRVGGGRERRREGGMEARREGQKERDGWTDRNIARQRKTDTEAEGLYNNK